jgi:hypothetical protein
MHCSKRHLLFIALSLADLVLTCSMLDRFGGQVYEANPIAGWWLAQHGWVGLVGFKALLVTLVFGLTLLIARSHGRAASRVLKVGCAALALVLLYSVGVGTVAAARESAAERRAQKALEQDKRWLHDRNQQRREFWAVVAQLGERLIAGSTSLSEAALYLAQTKFANDPSWQIALQANYAGCRRLEMYAALLVHETIRALYDDAQTIAERAAWLEQEFQRTYGRNLPADPVAAADEGKGAI